MGSPRRRIRALLNGNSRKSISWARRPGGRETRHASWPSMAALLWLWSGGSSLERIDPITGTETATVEAPAGGHFAAVGDEAGRAALPGGSHEGESPDWLALQKCWATFPSTASTSRRSRSHKARAATPVRGGEAWWTWRRRRALWSQGPCGPWCGSGTREGVSTPTNAAPNRLGHVRLDSKGIRLRPNGCRRFVR